MLYYGELMSEMQSKEPAIEGYTRIFVVTCMTDIFVQTFEHTKRLMKQFNSYLITKSHKQNNPQDMWITSDDDSGKEGQDLPQLEESKSAESENENQQISPGLIYHTHMQIALQTLASAISYDFTSMYPEEASDQFNTIVLLREKTISNERQSKWAGLFSKSFVTELFKFYKLVIEESFYEEAYEIMNLIHLLTLIRPNMFKDINRRIEFTCLMSEFWNMIFENKLGLDNNQILLKFCQMLSTFNKCINIVDMPYLSKWLKNAHSFTIQLLYPDISNTPFGWIHYTLIFWETISYKCIFKNRDEALTQAAKYISDVFQRYVLYLAQQVQTDGFADSVTVEEKLEPTSALVRAEFDESVGYMITNLEHIGKQYIFTPLIIL